MLQIKQELSDLAKADINDVVRNINVEETNILKWNGTLFPVSSITV